VRVQALLLAIFLALSAMVTACVQAQAQPSGDSIRAVVVLMRHGVRSPTHPDELAQYAQQPWRKFDVKPGYLTAHGAMLAQQLGEYYRKTYLPSTGCPAQGAVSIWADVDERTVETGKAIAAGFAPGCSITVGHAAGDGDPLFDPPGVAKVDAALSLASLKGAVGGDPNSLNTAYHAQFAALEEILGCTHSTGCKSISSVPSAIDSKGDGRLAGLSGGIDLAAGAAENLLLEYTDGAPSPGWGRLTGNRLIEVIQLHAIAKQLEHNRYAGRAHASNIMAHILHELQSPPARVSFLVGHDTQLEELSGMLGLSWLVKGDAMNDTPPGSALVWELHAAADGSQYVSVYFLAQSLDDMRAGHGTNPQRVPVFIPGCPSLECPIDTFASVINGAIDPKFVAP
jgi:4-phytase/acid phosphatase